MLSGVSSTHIWWQAVCQGSLCMPHSQSQPARRQQTNPPGENSLSLPTAFEDMGATKDKDEDANGEKLST